MLSFWDEINFALNEMKARIARDPRKIEFGWEVWEEVKKLNVDRVPAKTFSEHLTTHAALGTPVYVLYCLAPDMMIVTPNGVSI